MTGSGDEVDVRIGRAVKRSEKLSKKPALDPRNPVVAPTRINGAVSPIARARDSTVPVRIPGAA